MTGWNVQRCLLKRRSLCFESLAVLSLIMYLYILYSMEEEKTNDLNTTRTGHNIDGGKHAKEIKMDEINLKRIRNNLEWISGKTGVAVTALEAMLFHKVPIFYDHNGHSPRRQSVVCYIEITLSHCDRPGGLAALVLMTVELIASCLVLGGEPIVQWHHCDFCGTDNTQQVNHFEWFFKSEKPTIEKGITPEHRICLMFDIPPIQSFGGDALLDLSFNPTVRPEDAYPTHAVITPRTRLLAHYVLTEYFKPADAVMKSVEETFDKRMRGYVNIGVHVRATDHSLEVLKLTTLDQWVAETKKIVKAVTFSDEALPRSLRHQRINDKSGTDSIRIFLATDNEETVERFKKEFGEIVHWHNADRMRYFNATDSRHFIQNSKLARGTGRAVLRDIIMLAKCDLVLHGESSVSAMAHYLNLNTESYYVQTGKPGSWLPSHAYPKTSEGIIAAAKSLLDISRKRLINSVTEHEQINEFLVNDVYRNKDTSLHFCLAKNRFKSHCTSARDFTFTPLKDLIHLI